MTLNEEILRQKKLMQINENDDYRIDHSAPDKDASPMYNLADVYGDDIYGNNALRYFGVYQNGTDRQCLHVIQSAKNKPNTPVKIYRAVPDVNNDVKQKIKELRGLLDYHAKYRFFPMRNHIIYSLEDKYSIDNYEYDDQQAKIADDIQIQINQLIPTLTKPIKINSGDWVTINLEYAKEHGNSNLKKFTIISKTVMAKQLFTYGDSIYEWGYQE